MEKHREVSIGSSGPKSNTIHMDSRCKGSNSKIILVGRIISKIEFHKGAIVGVLKFA